MKRIFYLFVLLPLISFAQPTGYRGMRLNGTLMTYETFVYNSPGILPTNSYLTTREKDSTYFAFYHKTFRINYLSSSTAVYITTDASGNLLKNPITDIFDPTDYYDKTTADGLFLQSFTELDPVFVGDSNLFAKKTYSFSKTQSDARYLQSFTELDPIYSGSSWFSTTNNSTDWNTAFGWGNHAAAGYATASSTTTFTNKSGNISQWTNNVGYLTGITSGQVITALGYTPINPNGTTAQYFRGDGTLATFPSIPSQVNITGGQNTKVTGSYPNITIADSTTTRYYNGSGRINQNMKIWTANVTPSTSNGYSIDISAAGFSTITSVQVIAVRNTSSATTSPNVSIKSKSTTAVVVNVVEDNPATVTILGINVLSGSPSIFANVSGLTLDVTVIGY